MRSIIDRRLSPCRGGKDSQEHDSVSTAELLARHNVLVATLAPSDTAAEN
jgi:hypothetical protein